MWWGSTEDGHFIQPWDEGTKGCGQKMLSRSGNIELSLGGWMGFSVRGRRIRKVFWTQERALVKAQR